eukprot:TRINITY_DN9718_c0_g1_i1.p1 TRINITY_DN9718_c0_g1~~TRINITY_DN9718_c0_g1_i1.p1  ORF type:complete len:449 (+),score=104.78 TRINITY_DN9718_c0_g1_i1:1-1347(+)
MQSSSSPPQAAKRLIHDFQIVILAGGSGRGLRPMTSDQMPKALLPVANRVLLSYQLEFVSKLGFPEVIVVTTERYEDAIQQFLHIHKDTTHDAVQVVLKVVPDYFGTAAVLVSLKPELKGDIIVMGADVIVEGDFLHHMADMHRAKDAAVTVLAWQTKVEEDKPPAADEIVEYFAVDPKTDRLLMLFDSDSLNTDFIKVKKKLFRRFPNFVLYPTMRDAHFYMFSKWTLDVLEKNQESMESIQADFIPFLTRCQYEKHLVDGVNVPSILSPQVADMSSYRNDPTDKVKCFMYKFPDQGGKKYCDRVDSIASFLEINRKIAEGGKEYQPYEPKGPLPKILNFIATSAKIEKTTAVPSGSIIGADTSVGERVGVKKGIIGTHCKIGNNAKIINSVIFDHVTIEDGAKVQNSIVGANSYIEKDAELMECIMGSASKVPAGVTWRGKKSVAQ